MITLAHSARAPANPKSKIQNLKLTRRRGVVLLIVLSLLALFVLLGVTYTLGVAQYYNASRLELKEQQYGDLPNTETDIVLGQLLYDSAAKSTLQYQSLLSDLYGYSPGTDSISGTVGYPLRTATPNTLPATPNTGRQFYTVGIIPAAGVTLSPIPNYYAGRVITFQNGPAANHSTRIVAYAPIGGTQIDPNVPLPHFIIEAVESKLAGSVTQFIQGPTVSGAPNGNSFVINGAPFNGAGSGYDPTSYGINATYAAPGGLPAYSTALLPNVAAYDAAGTITSPIDAGGLDEPWDAPDLQNMFLAMVPPRAAEQFAAGNPANYLPIIPSFHRPELVNYWVNQLQSSGDARNLSAATNIASLSPAQKDFLRTIIFRPMPWDHPNFTGSNPNFTSSSLVPQLVGNLINASNLAMWDIDNDGDGLPDSIFIDPGLPVITSPSGRRYKRLAAILIKDLDGSINLNAHGNLQQVVSANYRAEFAAQNPMLPGTYTPPPTGVLGMAPAGTLIPRGMGFGPAEVDFLKIFTANTPAHGDTNAVNVYRQLLRARYDSKLVGAGLVYDRYDPTIANSGNAAPGVPTPGVVSAADHRDPLAAIKHAGLPNDYANLANQPFAQWYAQPSWYASPPDVWGRSAVVLDVGGQPLFAYAGQNNEAVDSPYELCLSGETNNADTPYTVAELERLLRYHDSDSPQLPPRLLLTATAGGYQYFSSESPGVVLPPTAPLSGSHRRRNMVTTLSSEVSVPATAIPAEFRSVMATSLNKFPGSSSILDLYAYKLQNGGLSGPQLAIEMQKIVPWEFFKGQKFDLNRSFGDGVDNNSDGARDDLFEAAGNEPAWQGGNANVLPNLPATFSSNPTAIYPQYTNGVGYVNATGTYVADNLYARQLYARHLFCMAMLFLPNNFLPTNAFDINANNGANYQKLMIRRIAQWAVNCVDQRDSDSVMTPFEFDYNPWDGWHVDGSLTTDGDTQPEFVPGLPAINPLDRSVVWGVEAPDLLLTETLAVHDRRVKDTANDDGANGSMGNRRTDMTNPDPDLDQFRIPQGSLFVEVYCPRPTTWTGELGNNKPQLPRELYDASGHLLLGKVSPNNYPVWRLALSRLQQPDYGNANNRQLLHPFAAVGDGTNPAYPLSASFEPASPSLMPGTTTPVTIDRYAYLGDASGLPATERAQAFYTTAYPQLFPGQYAVVGPRPITYLGSQEPATANPLPTAGGLWGGNSRQAIQLTGAGGVIVTDTQGIQTSRTAGTDMRVPLGIVCAFPAGTVTPVTNGAVPWSAPNLWPIGMNVTEPLPGSSYYPEPLYAPTSSFPSTTVRDFYSDPDDTSMNSFKDQPVESTNNTNAAGRPIMDNSMTNTGTYFDYSAVYLQRLANPNLNYDPVQNPYITVDWQTIDVHVFNGEELRQNNTNPAAQPFDLDDNLSGELKFRSRQRGLVGLNSSVLQPTSNPWPPVTSYAWPNTNTFYNLPITTNSFTSGPYFTADLTDNLTTSAYTYDSPASPPADRHSLGYVNSTVDRPLTTGAAANYVGEPSNNPFPWIASNNRPFMNAMELLAVPASSPGRYFLEMTPGFPPPNPAAPIPPAAPTTPYADVTANVGSLHLPFGQMLNFFQTTQITTPGNAPNFYRLLDFVEVPSPYSGAERWYNPQSLAGTVDGTGQFINGINSMRGFHYHPPFNKLSRFRDPGRVNINTIFDTEVWDSVVGQFPGLRTTDNMATQVLLSRQGHAGSLFSMDSSYPTRFANPFRPADSADLMPNVGTMRKQLPVQATLLRPDPTLTTQPLFAINSNNGQYNNWIGNSPLSPTPNPLYVGQYHDITRNPYFAYQTYQKLGSVFTTRSNCFAVWITIGYFEVEDYRLTTGGPVVIDAAHPDGLALAQEVGIDTGEAVRHRAFYIIDRSIPVGFLPGSKLNTDDCVLIRRMIE